MDQYKIDKFHFFWEPRKRFSPFPTDMSRVQISRRISAAGPSLKKAGPATETRQMTGKGLYHFLGENIYLKEILKAGKGPTLTLRNDCDDDKGRYTSHDVAKQWRALEVFEVRDQYLPPPPFPFPSASLRLPPPFTGQCAC